MHVVLVLLTFGPFKQVNLQNGLRWGLPPSDQQPNHWPRLLQGLHCPAMNHLRHIHVIHTQHTVIHAAERNTVSKAINVFIQGYGRERS